MRAISFEHFKNNCEHYEEDFDFDKLMCEHSGHDHKQVFTKDPNTGKVYYYNRCCEKHCPVLEGCKKI